MQIKNFVLILFLFLFLTNAIYSDNFSSLPVVTSTLSVINHPTDAGYQTLRPIIAPDILVELEEEEVIPDPRFYGILGLSADSDQNFIGTWRFASVVVNKSGTYALITIQCDNYAITYPIQKYENAWVLGYGIAELTELQE